MDLGAGEGFVQMALRDAFGCRVAALDADAAILRQGLARGTETAGAVSLLGDGLRLPFPDGIFDAVVCSEVLEHVPDNAGVVGEIARLLKPGGVAALTVPCANYPGLWGPANWSRERLPGTFQPGLGLLGRAVGDASAAVSPGAVSPTHCWREAAGRDALRRLDPLVPAVQPHAPPNRQAAVWTVTGVIERLPLDGEVRLRAYPPSASRVESPHVGAAPHAVHRSSQRPPSRPIRAVCEPGHSSGPEGAMRSSGAPLVQTTDPRIRSCSSAVHPSLSRRVGVTALAGGD